VHRKSEPLMATKLHPNSFRHSGIPIKSFEDLIGIPEYPTMLLLKKERVSFTFTGEEQETSVKD
jgi:hypothetical protein